MSAEASAETAAEEPAEVATPSAADEPAAPAEQGAAPAEEPAVPAEEWLRLSPRALAVRPVTDLLRSAPVLVALLYEGMRGGHNNYWGVAFGAFAVLAGI